MDKNECSTSCRPPKKLGMEGNGGDWVDGGRHSAARLWPKGNDNCRRGSSNSSSSGDTKIKWSRGFIAGRERGEISWISCPAEESQVVYAPLRPTCLLNPLETSLDRRRNYLFKKKIMLISPLLLILENPSPLGKARIWALHLCNTFFT